MESVIRILQPYARRYRKGAGDRKNSFVDRHQLAIYMVVSTVFCGSMFRSFLTLQEYRYPSLVHELEAGKTELIRSKMADRAAMDLHDNRTKQMREDMTSRK
eukprot:TRINITY_DN19134_c0_g1_i1.p1 TRINITY_DN19134_c0_g1~~TRINITY_DN19134_c0_g1_i1.p1  ORF type:complete len:111 (+),score=15.64 TRINITY_DN19134_c0_g1_i1:30-335(+)